MYSVFILQKHIRANLSENIKIEQLAAIGNCSNSTVFRLFEDHCKLPPGAFILQERLITARNLLLQPNITVSEVAYECGFNSVSYFVKQFKEQNNCTPGDFIKKFRLS